MPDDIADIVTRDVDTLRGIRDELKLQMHLGQAEARERFEALEQRWHHLEAKLRQLRDASRHELKDVGAAAQVLVDEIREGYRHVKSLI
jgi:BMFP domain-containing protein YqiC